jgi:hypothetical protein
MKSRLAYELLMACFSKEELAKMYVKRLEELTEARLVRDAALNDLKSVSSCRACANLNQYGVCDLNYQNCEWKWRGEKND